MRKKLNVKLVLGLFLGLVAFGACTHLLHGFQVRRNAGVFLDRANDADANGEKARMVDYLSRYLHYRPDDVKARARLGLTLIDVAKTPRARLRAMETLEHVLREDPNELDVRRRLAKALLEERRLPDAQYHLEKLKNALPRDGEVHLLLGRCLEASGDPQNAARSYQQAIAIAPQLWESYVRLANLRRRQGDAREETDKLMQAMVAANDKSYQVYLARAGYHRQVGDAGAAAADLAKARELGPDEPDVLIAIAGQALAEARGLRDRDEARKVLEGALPSLERGLTMHSKNLQLYLTLAQVEWEAKRHADAIAHLRRGLEALPGDGDLYWLLARIQIDAQQLPAAEVTIAEMRAARVPEVLVRFLEGRILQNKDRWPEAAAIFEKVLPQVVSIPALAEETNLALGQCYGQMAEPELQHLAYRRVVAANPASVTGTLGVASALLSLNRLDDAMEAYRRIIPVAPGVQIELARLMLLRNWRLPPDQRKFDDVDRFLNAAGRQYPDNVSIILLRAESLTGQGRVDEARTLLTEARDRLPDRVELWLGLVNLAQRQGQFQIAHALLEGAEQKLGDVAEVRGARIRHWARRQGPEAPRELELLARDLDRFKPEEKHRLLGELAQAHTALGDSQAARRYWEELAVHTPNDLGVRSVLFDLAILADDEKALEQAIAELQRVQGAEGSVYQYALACQLIRQFKRGGDKNVLEQAREHLDAAAQRRPTWSRIWVREAEIAELQGNPEQAIEHYQRAVELGERNTVVARRVAQLLLARGRQVEAQNVVKRLAEEGPLDGDLERIVATLALWNHDYQKALDSATKAISPDSKDYREQLWLGLIQARAGKEKDAEAAFRRAVALAEANPEPYLPLVQFLVATKQNEAAEAVLRTAEAKLDRQRAAVALGQCNEILGRLDEAKKLYDGALAANPDDVEALRALVAFEFRKKNSDEVVALLRRVLALEERGKPPAETAWARKLLAAILASKGTARDSREALNLLGVRDLSEASRAKLASLPPDELRLRAVLLAAQPHRAYRLEAVRLLESLAKHQQLTADDQHQLAVVHENLGDWPKAKTLLLEIATNEPPERPELRETFYAKQYQYLVRLINGILNNEGGNAANDASAWLARLEKLDRSQPPQWQTVGLKSKILALQGKTDEAVALVKNYVTTQEPPVMRLAARLMEEIKQPEAAEELYRQYVAKAGKPEAILSLAEFYGRQKRMDEALAACEQARLQCPPMLVAETSLKLLYGGSPNPSQVQRVTAWLEEAARKGPASAEVYSGLGAIRNLQGRYQESEEAYRHVLAIDPDDATALNNLAYLLAARNAPGREALELINKAIAVHGPNPELLDTRAFVYLRIGEGELAIKDLQAALADAPRAAAWFHLAQAHYLANNRVAALQALKKGHDAGLRANALHALEQKAYEQLVKELDAKR